MVMLIQMDKTHLIKTNIYHQINNSVFDVVRILGVLHIELDIFIYNYNYIQNNVLN